MDGPSKSSKINDGTEDCLGGTDESECTDSDKVRCAKGCIYKGKMTWEGETGCDGDECIPKSWVDDGYWDCKWGTDE